VPEGINQSCTHLINLQSAQQTSKLRVNDSNDVLLGKFEALRFAGIEHVARLTDHNPIV
jgi:hypothetical protein